MSVVLITGCSSGLDPAARERFIRAVNDTAWWSAGEAKYRVRVKLQGALPVAGQVVILL